MEAVAERPDGKRIPFIPYPTPLFDASGRLTGAINLLVDITERSQAEYDKQQLAAIVDSSDDAIVSKDINGIVTSWNAGAERLFGYSAKEMIGKSITLLIPAHLLQEEASILEQIARGERIDHFETIRVRKDGTLVRISLTISPVRNLHGTVIGASKIARDITERMKAELALAERTLQLALAGKAARVGSFAYDIDTERMQISAGYAAIHGLPDEATEITCNEWQLGVHPEDRVRWEAIRSRAHRERWPEYSWEYRIVRPGGEIRWVEARVFVSYDADGRPQRAVGVDIDSTARKHAEEQQRILNAELDHRVKNVLATVSAIAAHTKDSSRSMDHFVAALDSRIHSMASTHELLSSSRWEGVSLRELVRRELAPYASNDNTCIKGPDVILRAEAAQTTASVLHELTTNAAKYGALSKPEGRVAVCWRLASNGQAPGPLTIEWHEAGGPPVQAPRNSGYGTSVIAELLPYELGGTARLAFNQEGVQCRLDIPAKWLTVDSEQT
jgi:PAS domain S-box-containing protein